MWMCVHVKEVNNKCMLVVASCVHQRFSKGMWFVHARQITDAENVEAEALADGLVDKLIREAVKAHMASQGQGSVSIILRKKSHMHKDHFQQLSPIFFPQLQIHCSKN